MSYARMGWEDSDVYIFLHVDGFLQCCGCSLIEYKLEKRDFLGKEREMPTAQEPFPNYKTVEEMLNHLEEHKKAGHTVPDSCIEELKADKDHIEEFCK